MNLMRWEILHWWLAALDTFNFHVFVVILSIIPCKRKRTEMPNVIESKAYYNSINWILPPSHLKCPPFPFSLSYSRCPLSIFGNKSLSSLIKIFNYLFSLYLLRLTTLLKITCHSRMWTSWMRRREYNFLLNKCNMFLQDDPSIELAIIWSGWDNYLLPLSH